MDLGTTIRLPCHVDNLPGKYRLTVLCHVYLGTTICLPCHVDNLPGIYCLTLPHHINISLLSFQIQKCEGQLYGVMTGATGNIYQVLCYCSTNYIQQLLVSGRQASYAICSVGQFSFRSTVPVFIFSAVLWVSSSSAQTESPVWFQPFRTVSKNFKNSKLN